MVLRTFAFMDGDRDDALGASGAGSWDHDSVVLPLNKRRGLPHASGTGRYQITC